MSDKSCPFGRPAIIFEAVQCQTLIAWRNKQHETNGYAVCRDSVEGDGVTAGGTDGVELLTVCTAGFGQA
jgi:hypothetical protein